MFEALNLGLPQYGKSKTAWRYLLGRGHIAGYRMKVYGGMCTTEFSSYAIDDDKTVTRVADCPKTIRESDWGPNKSS